MDAFRKAKTFQGAHDSGSDDDVKPKRLVSKDILDKLDFDNIQTDIPFGFKPIGGFSNPFDGKGDDESNSDGDEHINGDLVHQFKLSSVDEIYKQVEKDLKSKVKISGESKDSTSTSSTVEKVSFPMAPGQGVASFEELKKDLFVARKSNNHKAIVSLCSSIVRKAPSRDEKIAFLAEKFRTLEFLKMDKLCEETANEILALDPQNIEYKFFKTKLLIKNCKDIWESQIEYLRARSLVEEKLSKDPDNFDYIKILESLEQIYYSLKVKIQEQKKNSKSYIQIGGNNTHGSCGNGSDESTKESFVVINELINKKISSIATGDFHTIVVAELLKSEKDLENINTDIGDTDVIGFGFNKHGQVDGIPSQDSILYPKVVPFFIGKRVKIVGACRSRSVALTQDGSVYEWGFVGSDYEQFHKIHDFSELLKSADKESDDEIVDIKCGLQFTIFLSKNGKVWISGCISQIGEFVFESEELILLNDICGGSSILDLTPSFAKGFMESRLKEKGELKEKKQVKFSKIDAGYSHALLLDTNGVVYVFGAGVYGQLGLGFDIIKAKKPMILEELNEGSDKILNISCGSNSCIAYSELGLCYVWGMINGTDLDSITYFPTVIGMPDRFIISHLNTQLREIIACDINGVLYKCDMELRRRLEKVDKDKYLLKNNSEFFVRKVFCGRSMTILLDSILSPEKSCVCSKVERMETLVESEITIELFDILNDSYCLKDDKDLREDMFKNIKILFTDREDINLSHFKISDYNPLKSIDPKKIKVKEIQEKEDSEEEIITTKASVTSTDFAKKPKKKALNIKAKPKLKVKENSGKMNRLESSVASTTDSSTFEEEKQELSFLKSDYNKVKFKIYYEVDPDYPSKISCKLIPSGDDEFSSVFVRIFIGNTELKNSNFQVEIVKSQLQLDLEAENQKKMELEAIMLEQRRVEKLKAKQEKERKKKEKEEERIRQQKLKEEADKQRKEETMKRAQEAVKKAKEIIIIFTYPFIFLIELNFKVAVIVRLWYPALSISEIFLTFEFVNLIKKENDMKNKQ